MAVIMNNINIENVLYKNSPNASPIQLDKLVFDGVVVWENWKRITDEPLSSSTDCSSGGWDQWYSFGNDWVAVPKPIKNPKGYVYISTRDTSASNSRGYVRYEDGTEELIGHANQPYRGGNTSGSSTDRFNLTNNKIITHYRITGDHKKFSGHTYIEIKLEEYDRKG